jgi:hypothetical protein
VGFAEVAALANKAAQALSRSMSIPESVSAIRALIAACHRAAAKHAPAKATGAA